MTLHRHINHIFFFLFFFYINHILSNFLEDSDRPNLIGSIFLHEIYFKGFSKNV